MFLMIRCAMSAKGCTATVAMLPTSVETYTAFATTASIAGLLCTLHPARRTTAALSRRMEIVHEPSTSFLRRHV